MLPPQEESGYAHSSSSVLPREDGPLAEIRDFLGEKITSLGVVRAGVACSVSRTQKDEPILEGTDTKLVSNSAGLIPQATTLKNKAIRKLWMPSLILKGE